MKADSELKVKLVAEYDGSGAKQAARSAEDTAETVSKANAFRGNERFPLNETLKQRTSKRW